MTPKFSIGDIVWRPTFDTEKAYVECPDCGGTGRLRVTFHDDTEVSIECRNCSSGYEPPTGRVSYYEREAAAHQGVVSGIEVEAEGVTYRLRQGPHSAWLVKEEELSDTYAAAMVKAGVMALAASEEEQARIYRKEKDTRTWSWNASYHRGCIKKAQRDLEYHTKKLSAANLKVRAEKAA